MKHLQRRLICGAAGGLLASLFGGWSSDLSTLVICMAVDFLTGLIAAALRRSEKAVNTSTNGLSITDNGFSCKPYRNSYYAFRAGST